MKTYIGLTIGPIYDTLKSARKTRELWGASALFSYIMRQIIIELQNEGASFIVPDLSQFRLDQAYGVGLFHDRFICSDTTVEKVKSVQETVIRDVATQMTQNAGEVQWLISYLQCYIAEVELEEHNVIVGMSQILDTLELHSKIPDIESSNPLNRFLRDRLSGSFLTKAFLSSKKISFDSLPEIAARDVVENMSEWRDEDDFDVLRKHQSFKQPHSYIAIVHADGDNFGTYLKTLTTISEQQLFSRKIFEYSAQLNNLIASLGGATIFAGGDDLLAFMPVVYHGKSFFNSVQEIDELFNTYFGDTGATLSYGFSVTYHKFPLYEALEKSRNALYMSKNNGKNSVTIAAQKHSGQSFDFSISKNNSDIFNSFKILLNDVMNGDVELPHSLHHTLDHHKVILELIGRNKLKLDAFFENNFNEEIHKEKFNKGLNIIATIINHVYNDDTIAKQDKFKYLFAALSTIKFLRGDR